MITVTYTKNGPRIAGLKAEAKGARRLLARVRDYHEWRAAERPNNRAKHMRKRVVGLPSGQIWATGSGVWEWLEHPSLDPRSPIFGPAPQRR